MSQTISTPWLGKYVSQSNDTTRDVLEAQWTMALMCVDKLKSRSKAFVFLLSFLPSSFMGALVKQKCNKSDLSKNNETLYGGF